MQTPTRLYLSKTLRGIETACRDLPLMQRAGTAAAAWAIELIADHPGPILILAGPGNNGGDAFVAATCLRERGFSVETIFAADAARLPADAQLAYRQYLTAGGVIREQIPAEPRDWRLIIDGIFGIGLTRAPAPPYVAWIQQANQLRRQHACPLLALDCPSGLDADRGTTLGEAIAATHTISFIGAKPGLYTADGPDHCGEIRVATLIEDQTRLHAPDGHLITPELFAHCLQPRLRNTHKGSFGSAGIAGGAATMTGAAILAGRAALKLGAGRVYLGLMESQTHLDPGQPEIMIRRPAGLLDAGLNALACGPGLGGSLEAVQLLEMALATELPLVLDADALSLLAQEGNLKVALASREAPTLLTPHPGEAARLLDTEVSEVQADRIAAACEMARQFGCLVALKGCGTVIATADGHWWINTTGNPGMANAGMGDVLTGIAVSLLAQGWPAQEALLAGVHLHGAAADTLVSSGVGPVGLTACEVIDAARRCFNRWLQHA